MMFLSLLLSLAFPLGIWLGLEGYELVSLFCLLIGWGPISAAVMVYLSNELSDLKEDQPTNS